ncbi:HAMP domain-containing protein [bacterium]|nr:HAMP domain-containing protein [bacterium]
MLRAIFKAYPSIDFKLVFPITLLLGGISIFIYYYFPSIYQKQAISSFVERYTNNAEMIGLSIGPALYFDDHKEAEMVLAGTIRNPDIAYLIITDSTGSLFSAYNLKEAEKYNYNIQASIPYTDISWQIEKIQADIWLGEEKIGKLFLGAYLNRINAAIYRFHASILMISLVLFIIGIAIALSIAGIISKPLKKMVIVVKRITAGDLRQRTVGESSDEVGQLSKAFNHMLDNLELVKNDLEQLNTELEDRVEDRTKELQKEIEERTRIEAELLDSKQTLQTTYDAIPDAVFSTDMMFNILSCNISVERIFGFNLNKLKGLEYLVLLKENIFSSKDKKDQLAKLLLDGYLNIDILEFKKKNGDYFHGSLSIALIKDKNGTPIGTVGAIRDISESIITQNKLEDALSQAERALNVKTLFMTNMSHEIRTPLNSMLGFSQLLEVKFKDLIGDEDQVIFEMINTSGKRLIQTVHEILDISQMETGTYALSREKIDLKECIESLIIEHSHIIAEKNLELKTEFCADDISIYADRKSVDSVLFVLLDNSFKYTNAGYIKISTKKHGDNVILAIEDTGIGISEEYQEQIFEPFSQESVGYTKRYQGLGLGLSLAKQHCEMNDISIDLISEKDVGTTFRLTIKEYDEKHETAEIQNRIA